MSRSRHRLVLELISLTILAPAAHGGEVQVTGAGRSSGASTSTGSVSSGTASVPAAVGPVIDWSSYPYGPWAPYWLRWSRPATIIVIRPPGDGPIFAGPVPGPFVGEPLPARLPAPQIAQQSRGRSRVESPERVAQLVTLGDRFFRVGNYFRAADRYQQALRADPTAAAPRIRLAQLALRKDEYAEAANLFREALTGEPGWLTTAPDIQSIYGEPADFQAPLDRLESHLQVHPTDRDGWLVLGMQWFLSGRTQQASDVFLRLSDRRGDPVLATLLAATLGDGPVDP